MIKSIETQDELRNLNKIFKLEQQLFQNQINPHFIFNCLNSIQKLVLNHEEQKAFEYISKFSKLLRKTLNNTDKILCSLSEELESLQIYIELELMRCDNRFNFNLKLDPNIDINEIAIPILLIQPYVENAIWHGIMNLPKENKGNLLIEINQHNELLNISIIDNGIGIKAANLVKEKTHISKGLNINSKRLESINFLMKDKKANVSANDNLSGGTTICILIPVIPFSNY